MMIINSSDLDYDLSKDIKELKKDQYSYNAQSGIGLGLNIKVSVNFLQFCKVIVLII